ncbi:MAG: glycoside hydrolase family 32 protein [Planctomycetota bacterium]
MIYNHKMKSGMMFMIHISNNRLVYFGGHLLLGIALLATVSCCVSAEVVHESEEPSMFNPYTKETSYKEPYRPQFHFSAKNGWMNDINALWYLNGTYHMTYQQFTPRHGGYATSQDLVHWVDRGTALIPEDTHLRDLGAVPNVSGKQVYSGSGVVLEGDAAEKITGSPKPALVTLYTGTAVGTCIAWSNDEGKTWHNYPNNPVAHPTTFQDPRDPCIVWYAPDQKWICAIYEKGPGDTGFYSPGTSFYRSDDLIEWEKTSHIDFGFECPDLFELPVDGDPGNKKWVLLDAQGKYLVGHFDGKSFMPEQDAKLMDVGPDFYAPQSFYPHNLPEYEIIQIAWMNRWKGGIGWDKSKTWDRNATFPVKIALVSQGDEVVVTRNPIPEISNLYFNSVQLKDEWLVSPAAGSEKTLLGDIQAKTVDIELVIDMNETTARGMAFQLNNRELYVDLKSLEIVAKKSFGVGGPKSTTEARFPLPDDGDGLLSIRILLDWSCLEIFAEGGRFSYTEQYGFDPQNQNMGLRAVDGKVKIKSLGFHQLKSIWE